jgi:hypothetical protein
MNRGVAAHELISKRDEEKAARQAAAERKRGGGERGSTERRKFAGFVSPIGEVNAANGFAAMVVGSTKAIELTSERSESWQQDMAQAIIPPISSPSCPQSM